MKICQLTNSTEKQAVTRSILEALPEWDIGTSLVSFLFFIIRNNSVS